MDLIKSRYTTAGQTWEERITAMRHDLQCHEYDYLFFKVALSLNEAKEMADYDRYSILKRLISEVRAKDGQAIAMTLTELEDIQ